jgi:hypothetical protein
MHFGIYLLSAQKSKGKERGCKMSRKIREKKTICSIVLTLMLTLAVFAALPAANSSTPPISVPSYPYLAISPNPVGVNQPVFFVMWVHGAPPTAAGNAGDRWHDYNLKIKKPDGTIDSKGPFISDPTGSTYTLYTPTQTGTYEVNFTYTGQVISLYNPVNGLPGDRNSPFINDTWLPSSTTATFTVQEEQVAPVEEYPLPTAFWTRPILGDNVRWSSIASNWLSGSHIGTYNLWQTGTGPKSSHIMWAESIELGGVVGGFWTPEYGITNSYIPDVGFYSGGSYEGRFTNAMIIGGILFYSEPLGHSAVGGGYTARDLATGEVIWHRDDLNVYEASLTGIPSTSKSSAAPSIAAPSFGQLYNYESPNQHGVVGGILWQSSSVGGFGGVTTWQAFDAFTGKWAFNLTGIPGGTEVRTNKGEIVRYVLNYNTTTKTGWLALWNNTMEQQGLQLGLGTTTNAWQWRPDGKTVDMSNAYSWNVSLTADLTGNSAPAIVQVLPGDIILGRSSLLAAGVGDKYTPDPFTMWAISDKPSNRGQLLWKQSYSAPSGNLTRRFASTPVDPVNRVFVMSDVETMQWLGYNLDTGELLWGPTNTQFRAYQYYGSGEGGGQRGALAYGNLYVQGFGGELHCYDTKNGNLVWTYNNTQSGLDTPWGLRPIFLAAIADGVVYAFNNEHSPNQPLYRGNSIYAINAFTGEEIYKMLSWAGQSGGRGSATSVLADGYLAYYNYYDGRIYSIGKGPSAITVSAPQTVVPKGTSVLITGTVTDQSPGAKGTPAISDANMARWMEYIYMQKPKPADATGVTVKLTAYDPNGNSQDLGTTTSDAFGKYGIVWTPSTEGTYYVQATFEGSNSYYGSADSTYFAVGPAPPSASVTPPPTSPPPITTTPPPISPSPTTPPPVTPPGEFPAAALYLAIAAVVIIAAVAAAAVILKRRK